MSFHRTFLLSLATLVALATPALAHRPSCAPNCDSGCVSDCAPAPIQYQSVERTIYVPQTTIETRTINVTQCQPETRERTVTIYKQVAETKSVMQTRTINVPEVRSRMETYHIAKPIFKDVSQTYTVMVPVTEPITLTRTVCTPYQQKMKRTVTVDQGHWEEQEVAPAPVACDNCGQCGNCGNCNQFGNCAPAAPCVRRVWVPNLVQKDEFCMMTRYKTEEVAYQSTRTVCKPEERTRTCRVLDHVEQEPHTRQVSYTVCVPKVEQREVPVTTWKCIPTQQVQHYTVMVPYTVEKQINVPVCRMVPKTIVCQVPVYTGCGNCGCN